MQLRPLAPRAADEDALAALWSRALGDRWPLEPAAAKDLGSSGVAAVDAGGQLVGAATVDAAGAITAIVVDPDHQRRGIGRALHVAALDLLAPVAEIGLGSGGDDYLFPGVPDDLPGAIAFFEASGWTWDYVATDLVLDLDGYRTPAGVHERARALGVTFRLVGGDDEARAGVLGFVDRDHHDWLGYYGAVDPARILVAERGGDVVAGLVLTRPGHLRTKWAALLGDDTGDLGCVGVRPDLEGEGIGTALVARGTEILQEAGVARCWLQWTVRLAFYGYLGYRPWRTFRMARADRMALAERPR